MRFVLGSFMFILGLCAPLVCDQPHNVLQKARERAEHASPKSEAKAEMELVRALVDDAAEQYAAEKYDNTRQAAPGGATGLEQSQRQRGRAPP